MNLRLSLAIGRNPRLAPLLDGRVRPAGIDLTVSELQAPDIFWRQMRFAEFDVSEMSLSSLLMMIDRGRNDWTALPVFHDRRFFHTYAVVRRGAGIDAPADLPGKNVGVPDYQQTAALWTRTILERDFDVRPSDMTWFMERSPRLSHGGAVNFEPPQGIELHYVSEETNLGEMLVEGTLDAALVYEPALIEGRTLSDRSPQRLPDAAITGLFADVDAERRRSYESLGYVPANHCIVVRTRVLEKDPWVAMNLFAVFDEARRLNMADVARSLSLYRDLGYVTCVNGDLFDPMLYPYGVRENRGLLEQLAASSVAQGLTSRAIPPEEYVAEPCLSI